jgi:hypothetical protein
MAFVVGLPGLVRGVQTGAVGNGDWSSVATWTSGVPGAGSFAYIGSHTPAGAAAIATVVLSQNSATNEVYVGYLPGTTGTLDLHGSSLVADFMYVGFGGGTGAVLRTGGGALSVSTFTVGYGNGFSFAPGDAVSLLQVVRANPIASTASTVAAGNVTSTALIDTGCALTMGADLGLSGSLTVNGTLNANGHSITATTIGVGVNAGPGAIQNDGQITAGRWNQGTGSQIRLNHAGDALGTLLLSQNSALALGDSAGQTTGLTIGNPTLADLSIDSTSDLILEINGLAGGWAFRWANPAGGDHVADLQTLINANQITFSYLNGGSYSLSADANYTYVNVIPVPEPGAFILTAAAACIVAAARRRRRAAA